MSDPVDRFAEEVAEIEEIRRKASNTHLHEYTGTLTETDSRVRLLTLAPELSDVDAAVTAFTRVSDQWFNASANPNIVGIVERGTTPRPWIAIPDWSGATLETVQTDLSPEAIETIIADTAEALRTLGLYNTVHGHLSPADIRVTNGEKETEDLSVQLGGFGLAQAIQTAVGEIEPTPYTAPELLDRSEEPNQRADVYGLGAITYFALTGHPPVDDDELEQAIRAGVETPPSAHREEVPAGLDDVVLQALAVESTNRHDSPYAFIRSFRSVFSADEFESPDESTQSDDGDTERDGDTSDSSDSEEAPSDDDVPRTAKSDKDYPTSSIARTLLFGGIGVVVMAILIYGSCLGLGMGIPGIGNPPGATCGGPSLGSVSAEAVGNGSQEIRVSGGINGMSDTNATVNVTVTHENGTEVLDDSSERQIDGSGTFSFTVRPDNTSLTPGTYNATVEFQGSSKTATFEVENESQATEAENDTPAESIETISGPATVDSASESVRIAGTTTGLAGQNVTVDINISSADDTQVTSNLSRDVTLNPDGTFNVSVPFNATGTQAPYEVTVTYNGTTTSGTFGAGSLESVEVWGGDKQAGGENASYMNFRGDIDGFAGESERTLSMRLERNSSIVYETSTQISISQNGQFSKTAFSVSDSGRALRDGNYTLVARYDGTQAEDAFSVPFTTE